MDYDVFISHASEDKENVVRPLAHELRRIGLRVWLDECELTIGDSLRRKIDAGLSHSKYGIVILSPAFFSKEWPNKELDGLFARENGKNKVILPVWHNVTANDVLKFSPMLADKVAISTTRGIVSIANTIASAVQPRVSEKISPLVEPIKSTGEKSNSYKKIISAFIIAIAISYITIRHRNESNLKNENDLTFQESTRKTTKDNGSSPAIQNPIILFSDRYLGDTINKIIINKGACPFECCQYGEWIALQQMNIDFFDSPNGKSVKEIIRKGEKIDALTGEVHSFPVAATVTNTYKTDEQQGIKINDKVYILHSIGEGAVALLHNGNIKKSSLDFRYELLNKSESKFPENTWWVKVRFKDGREGWIKEPSSFDGADRCA
jgi:hypothetical protein